MSDKPIIFSAPMIKALMSGSKTQTRRILKPQPYGDVLVHWGMEAYASAGKRDDGVLRVVSMPYRIGDRLWVRENCRAVESRVSGQDSVQYIADNGLRKIESTVQGANQWLDLYGYGKSAKRGKNVPSIHMPRWASRLTLIVTGVKVERLKDISPDDARSEGHPIADVLMFSQEAHDDAARDWFMDLWDSINGPGAWESNPWVVAVTFTVHQCNIDRMEV